MVSEIVVGLGLLFILMAWVTFSERRSHERWRVRAGEAERQLALEVKRVQQVERQIQIERELKHEQYASAQRWEALAQKATDHALELNERVREKDRVILEMKREGFAPPAADLTMQAFTAVKLPEEVMLAVDEVAPEGTQLRRSVLAQAEELYEQELENDEIVSQITAGSDLNPHHL